MKYLINNINKGIIPDAQELEEVMGSMDKRFYLDVCIALLSRIGQTPVIQEVKSLEEPVIEFESPNRQHSRSIPATQEAPKPTTSPSKVITPGASVGNILGNS